MKKMMSMSLVRSIFCFTSLVILYTPTYSKEVKEVDPARGKKERSKKDTRKWEIQYLIQPDADNLSPLEVTGLDVLIPGYGMFMLDKYLWGFVYGGAKLLGFVFIYLSVSSYQFWRPLEQSLVNEQSLVSGQTFELPGKSDRFSAQKIKDNYAKALLWVIMAATYQVLAYGISSWHTYLEALDQYKKEGPFYKIRLPQKNTQGRSKEMKIKAGYRFILY